MKGKSGKKLNTNLDLITDLMDYSPYGALGQVFIVEAIRSYAEQVLKKGLMESEIISAETWKGVAKDIKERADSFYNRYDEAEHDD